MAFDINTTQELTPLNIVALDAIDPTKLEPAKVYGSETELQKVDGKSVFRLGHVYAKDEDDRPITVSIRVFNRPEKAVGELTRIVLTGTVRFKPYVAQNGRLAYSVIADGVQAA